ncbi:MAG: UDP-N-acetylenolpyruvoylglucosamine reductase [Candidatus Spechtbacteria bacterium RIFCSPLOWO2_01_FULL_43_12]|uniref:UDP-N-acetylenolpyruvoylglucosamine reductase n=1 Tax=Candidatus Spechtbacteria bacterium RIFCSPLOWO2_01_FULL_43_12 TaxID=1802162 RepID=A0A1G2HED3_9BACT|nr:MAG: UDP-N-acetylenolpyruvoylglucosamine reductase [Candidatus Spechtbacteria bacterium RIFCSPLOWO2_01_FULL_43_12]
MKIEENVNLAKYTTYRIGGPARYFTECKSEQEVVDVLAWARDIAVPYFVLGGGSNVLVSDGGYDGLVLRMANTEYSWDKNTVRAGAGASMESLVNSSIESGFAGLEWAGGLPGQLGGALRGNAGAFGGEIKDIVKSVRAVSPEGKIRDFSKKECAFAYRISIFKEKPGYIIISAELEFKKGNAEELRRIADEKIEWRRAKHPMEYGNSGSIFKGVEPDKLPVSIKENYPELERAMRDGNVAAAFFIDQAGLKLKRVGGAEVSNKHPNFLVNRTGSARAEDVLMLASAVKSRVLQEFGVILEEEVHYLT